MPKLKITPEDHLKGKTIEPGTYTVKVKNVEEKPAKNDGSQTWKVEYQIIDGAYKGVPVYNTFSEKAPGFAISFVEACGGKIDPKSDYDLDFNKTIGVVLRVVIKNEFHNNKMTNKIDGYLPKN